MPWRTGGLDLAILDLNMPDMSGPDVITMFRAASLGSKKLPIIVLSADATPAAKQQSLDAGASEFITKPVTTATLLASIERVVAGEAARNGITANSRVGAANEIRASVLAIDPERLTALERIARGDVKFLETYLSASFAELEKAIADLRVGIRKGTPDLRVTPCTSSKVRAALWGRLR